MNWRDLDAALIGVLVLRAGIAAFQCGAVRGKNAVATMTLALVEASAAVLAVWAIGAAIATQQQTAFAGVNLQKLAAGGGALGMALLLTLPLAGAVAERGRFWAVVIVSAVAAGFAAPLAWNWLGYGDRFANPLYGHDRFAALALFSGAIVALVSARQAGPRLGKYNRDGSTTYFPAHNLPLQFAGAFLAAGGLILMSERPLGILAAAAGAVAAAVTAQLRYAKPDPWFTLLGLLAGGVAFLPTPQFLPEWGVVLVGLVAGVVAPLLAVQVELRLRVDDPTGLAPTILAAVVVGTIVGLAPVAWQMDRPGQQLTGDLLNMVAVAIVVGGLVLATWWGLRKTGWLPRVSEADEYDGLDLTIHDVNAYPDFQQTMIKSHHLRQA